MAEMSEAAFAKLTKLCEQGDACMVENDYAGALGHFWDAWDLLPEPQTEWEAATWILAAVGDANFQSGDYTAGRDNLSLAMQCPDGLGNPFLHLRLGQCWFELGNHEKATDELLRAYMGAGGEIFEGEAKYYSFLKERVEAPADGWEE
ncbi:MAG TPA: hypothetical protein VGE52_13265 [Pirellulales bacterium]